MDLRVQRTRNVIANALRHLLASRSLDDISVSDIVDSAGVSRSSFYAHFADKHELACQILAPITRGLVDAVTTRRGDADLASVTSRCLHDRKAILSVLRSSAREAIRRSMGSEMLRPGAEQDCRSRIAALSIAEAQLMIIELALSEREPISGHYVAQLIQQVASSACEAAGMAGHPQPAPVPAVNEAA